MGIYSKRGGRSTWTVDQYKRRGAAGEGGRGMRRVESSGAGARELVTASEVAAFVYCPEEWRLEYGLGLEPENRKRPVNCVLTAASNGRRRAQPEMGSGRGLRSDQRGGM